MVWYGMLRCGPLVLSDRYEVYIYLNTLWILVGVMMYCVNDILLEWISSVLLMQSCTSALRYPFWGGML